MSVPPVFNPDIHKQLQPKQQRNIAYYIDGIKTGNRYILSESITLLESSVPDKRALGTEILNHFKNDNTSTIRVGITGTPGVGKSTFIEAFGCYCISQGHKVAVLAIDPSSQVNQGSVLGDKTRMPNLSNREEAFIRPTASGTMLGGTAIHTKETIEMCEAAGYDMVLIETVGVGQSEIEVGFMSDVNILLLQPGAGDEIQGIKRGIMENADIFVINKADGALHSLAKQSKITYRNAIQLFHHPLEGWKMPIILVSSTEERGLDDVFLAIAQFKEKMLYQHLFSDKRTQQNQRWFYTKSKELIEELVFNHPEFRSNFKTLSDAIQNKSISPSSALSRINDILYKIIGS